MITMWLTIIGAGDSGAVELSNLAAEFGRTDCGSPDLCDGDSDGDGDVDGNDILAAVIGPGPEISFAATSTAAGEGDTIFIEISGSYIGQVTLELSGPAHQGADHGLACSGQECMAVVNDQGILQVPIIEDTLIEELEWLKIRILPGIGYQVGAISDYVITITDNDAVWEGVFSTKGEELGFSIEILRSGETVDAKLLAEGGGIIPAGAKNLPDPQVPMNFDLISKTFSATLPGVPLPQEDTLMGTNGTLILELEASQSTGSVETGRITGHSDQGSTSRMRMQFSGQSHLDSDQPGSFVLQRRPVKPSTWEIPLEDTY